MPGWVVNREEEREMPKPPTGLTKKIAGTNPPGDMASVEQSEPFPEQERRPEKERCTFHIPIDLMERVRNCVFWTPGLTMAALAEEGLRSALDSYEKKNGGAFPLRTANLKGGRPVK